MKQLDTQPFHRIYDIYCNYLPGYLYLLKFHVWLMGSAEAATRYIHYLKYYTLLFDLGAVLLLLSMCRNLRQQNLLWAVFVFNASYLYNTLNWGQIDAIPAFLAILALQCFIRKKPEFGMAAYLLALNVKLQMIIFAPLMLWLLWEALRTESLRRTLFTVLTGVILQTLLILPFLLGGTVVPLWRVIIGSAGYFERVSMNAFNFWYLVLPETVNPVEFSDRAIWLSGMSYHTWGILLFFCSIFLSATLLFGKRLLLAFRNRQFPSFSLDDYLLAGSIIALCFFFFPTQMHERYSHPVWLFLGLWSIRNARFLHFILFSVAYYLNMEMVLRSLELNTYEAFYFRPVFIATLYGILLVSMLYAAAIQGRRNTV